MISRYAIYASLFLLLGTAGCTVKPLYSGTGTVQNVSVTEADTRVGQQVRNRLLFLLNGSGATPSNPEYEAKITVSSSAAGVLKATTDIPESPSISLSRMDVSGTLTITKIGKTETLASYRRVKSASYDQSTQGFANNRARIDAEDRAAAELAEEFNILVTSFVKGR